jgi:hypothetical protein
MSEAKPGADPTCQMCNGTGRVVVFELPIGSMPSYKVCECITKYEPAVLVADRSLQSEADELTRHLAGECGGDCQYCHWSDRAEEEDDGQPSDTKEQADFAGDDDPNDWMERE